MQMESLSNSMETYSKEVLSSERTPGNVLQVKVAELFLTKEDLNEAKDEATQSWLDSRPLIDELEQLRADLENEKNLATERNSFILELESQIDFTGSSIKSTKEEEVKITGTIDQLHQSSAILRAEMEQIKLEIDDEKGRKSELIQLLRSRKQSLRTLRLTFRAIYMESEAFKQSSAESLQLINCSHTQNSTVQLTQKEYEALLTRAHEETSFADWRVSLSVDQRLLAEQSRELVQRESQVQYMESRSSEKQTEEITLLNIARHAEDSRNKVEDQINSRHKTILKAQAKVINENQSNSKQLIRSTSAKRRSELQKKKPSIFVQIQNLFACKITSWF